jgi:hypothetical protein
MNKPYRVTAALFIILTTFAAATIPARSQIRVDVYTRFRGQFNTGRTYSPLLY